MDAAGAAAPRGAVAQHPPAGMPSKPRWRASSGGGTRRRRATAPRAEVDDNAVVGDSAGVDSIVGATPMTDEAHS